MYLDPRECPGCHFVRVPETKKVKKNSRYYVIFKCRGCGMKDIDRYTPAMVWNGTSFIEEYPDETDFNEEGKNS